MSQSIFSTGNKQRILIKCSIYQYSSIDENIVVQVKWNPVSILVEVVTDWVWNNNISSLGQEVMIVHKYLIVLYGTLVFCARRHIVYEPLRNKLLNYDLLFFGFLLVFLIIYIVVWVVQWFLLDLLETDNGLRLVIIVCVDDLEGTLRLMQK